MNMRDESRQKKILPVDLFLEGRPCLVVGGGTIAVRKVGHLLDSGAKVTVVSPALCPEIDAWRKARRLRQISRVFKVSDVKGNVLVFAATDDNAVNLRILKACRRARILCCSVDAHWDKGDFLTPAIIRHPQVTVAVSTGGQSCKRARRVKEKLATFLAAQDL